MSKEIIVFITEGERAEKHIIDNLRTNFFNVDSNPKEVILLSFRAEIYQLFKKLKDDDFETEIIELLIERDPEVAIILSSNGRSKQAISQIFLFFDYDGYACNDDNGDEIIKEMIGVFDNETERGKLYVSYPMVEAIKDTKRVTVLAKVNINYKNLVTDCNEFNNLITLTLNNWKFILNNNIKRAIYVVTSLQDPFLYRDFQIHINQNSIFRFQLSKFIEFNHTVAVLSGFPFFLIDYYGENIYKEAL